jgi:hypothetical protein
MAALRSLSETTAVYRLRTAPQYDPRLMTYVRTNYGWQGVCTCGWRGPARTHRDDAYADRDKHRAERRDL